MQEQVKDKLFLDNHPSIRKHIEDHIKYGNSHQYICDEFCYPMSVIRLVAKELI